MKERKRPVYDQDRFKNKQTKQTLNKNKTKRPELLNPAIRGCGVTTMLFGVFFLQVLNLVVKQDR